jgi:uncharacterized damage-inducible protein DinB
MEKAVQTLIAQLTINSELVNKSVDDFRSGDPTIRINDRANSLSFILAHVTSARHYMAGMVGVTEKYALEDRFANNEKEADPSKYPSLAELKESYNAITAKLVDGISKASAAQLQKEIDLPFPVVERTVFGGLTFLTQHDAYHTGQMGYIGAVNGIEGPYARYKKS